MLFNNLDFSIKNLMYAKAWVRKSRYLDVYGSEINIYITTFIGEQHDMDLITELNQLFDKWNETK